MGPKKRQLNWQHWTVTANKKLCKNKIKNKKKRRKWDIKKKSDFFGLEPVSPFHRAHANLRLSARLTLSSFSLLFLSLPEWHNFNSKRQPMSFAVGTTWPAGDSVLRFSRRVAIWMAHRLSVLNITRPWRDVTTWLVWAPL